MKFTVNAALFMLAKTGSPYPIAERHLGLLYFLKGHHPSTLLDGTLINFLRKRFWIASLKSGFTQI